MTWEKIPCRWCGFVFENLQDRAAHEACHTDPIPAARTTEPVSGLAESDQTKGKP